VTNYEAIVILLINSAMADTIAEFIFSPVRFSKTGQKK